MPKVSIVVAVYNVDKYLKQCLDSLVNQTLQDIEFICVNDGSTDNSLEILKEYAAKDSRFKIITQENQGPGVARNEAIKNAIGEYLMIVDPDDWLELNACELAYNQITKNQNDMVFFGLQRYFEESGKTKIDTKKLKPFADIINNQKIYLSKLQNDYLKTSFTITQIYSQKFIIDNDVRYSETYLCEDTVFIVKAITSANTVSILNEPIYNYRVRNNSLSSGLKSHWKDLFTNRLIGLDIIKNSSNEQAYVYPYLIYVLNSTSYWYKRISNEYPFLKKNFHNELRKMYLLLYKEYDIQKIATYINYKKFKKICSSSWNKILFETILQNIFEITNIGQHKVITLLGFKIRLKTNGVN